MTARYRSQGRSFHRALRPLFCSRGHRLLRRRARRKKKEKKKKQWQEVPANQRRGRSSVTHARSGLQRRRGFTVQGAQRDPSDPSRCHSGGLISPPLPPPSGHFRETLDFEPQRFAAGGGGRENIFSYLLSSLYYEQNQNASLLFYN